MKSTALLCTSSWSLVRTRSITFCLMTSSRLVSLIIARMTARKVKTLAAQTMNYLLVLTSVRNRLFVQSLSKATMCSVAEALRPSQFFQMINIWFALIRLASSDSWKKAAFVSTPELSWDWLYNATFHKNSQLGVLPRVFLCFNDRKDNISSVNSTK